MILLYLSLIVVLALAHVLVRWRVRRLERRFSAIAARADALLKSSGYKGGNCARPDPYQAAKQQYELAQLAMKRDRIEQRYTSWQGFSERFGHLRRRVAGYRGRVLPYAFGILDVAALLIVLEHFGTGVAGLKSLLGI
jgi:hypothetical protein